MTPLLLGRRLKYIIDHLVHAVRYREEDNVKAILATGDVDVNSRDTEGTFPLLSACQGVLNTRIIKILLDAGANPNLQSLEDGTTPLFWAVMEIPSAVKLLLKHGADPTIPNKYGGTPLGKARRDYPAKYKLMLEYVAPEKRSKIDAAAYTKDLFDNLTSDEPDDSFAEECVQAGADINAVHQWGATILTHVIEHDNGFGFESALELKADVDKLDGRGKSPLLCAIESLRPDSANQDFAQELLKAGANPNLIHAGGLTPLMAAAQRGQADVVKALLKAGADPSIKDAQGRSALDYGREALKGNATKELTQIEVLLESKS